MAIQGRLQPLGDGWTGRFDYDATSRGWVPIALSVWHEAAKPLPPGGLPVRRLRALTVAPDLVALGPPPGATAVAGELTAEQRRTAAGRMQAIQLYDSMRMWGLTRREIAARMHVSEAWLKWVLSWARDQGYLDRSGEVTDVFALEYVRLQEV